MTVKNMKILILKGESRLSNPRKIPETNTVIDAQIPTESQIQSPIA